MKMNQRQQTCAVQRKFTPQNERVISEILRARFTLAKNAKICVFLLSVAKALKSKKPVRRVFDGLLQFLAALFASVSAEREGFEPSVPFNTHAFQACSIDHSDISPQKFELQI